MSNDCAGEWIAFICAVVIRGIKKPFELDLTSSIEEGSAVTPLVLMPIPWPHAVPTNNESNSVDRRSHLVLNPIQGTI